MCGAAVPWRFTRTGVAVQGLLAVAVVAALSVGLLWLRQSGRGSLSDAEQTARLGVIARRPTDVPTFTPPPPPSATRPPSTTRPPTPTPLPATVLHDVRSGDTLFGIAQDYAVTADDIISLNSLERPDALWIGQQLLIPLQRQAGEPPPEQVALVEGEAPSDDAGASGEDGDDAAPESADEAEAKAESADAEAPPETPDTEAVATGVPIVVQAAQSYTVERGDTLGRIAAEHGVPVDALVSLNDEWLTGPNHTLQVGDEVVVVAAVLATTTPAPAPAATRSSAVEQAGGTAGELAAVPFESPGEASFPRPVPLSPAGGITVTAESPLLRWSSAGVLPRGLYYVVAIREADDVESEPTIVWVTDVTALRVPSGLRPALGTTRPIEWSVSVRRRSDGRIGRSESVLLSPEPKWEPFAWAPGGAGADTQ